jgi:hypothetical protein
MNIKNPGGLACYFTLWMASDVVAKIKRASETLAQIRVFSHGR